MLPLFPPNDDMQAFLRACKANPDDDAPRLIFADYLEENGHPERAQFIRLQCVHTRLKAQGGYSWELARDLPNLRSRHAEAWLDPWRRGVRYEHRRFCRGLVDLYLTANYFGNLFQDDPTQAANFAWVERFTLLELPGPYQRRALAALQHCTELVALCLHGHHFVGGHHAQYAAWENFDFSKFTYLFELDLEPTAMPLGYFRNNLVRGQWSNIRKLRIRDGYLNAEIAGLLSDPSVLPALQELELKFPLLNEEHENVLWSRFEKTKAGRYVVKPP